MAYVVERTLVHGTRFMGMYLDPDGHKRSAGSFSTRREAQRAAHREEQKVLAGAWHDTSLGDITFHDFVETEWLPHKHLETSTRAAYLSYLNKHFYPFFGNRPLNRISPSLVQDWVAKAMADGLSPRSIQKYHVLLSSIFGRAVKDRVLVHNPCDHTELPKIITRRSRTLTPSRVRTTPRRPPRAAPAHGRHPHRDRTPVGRARRAQAPAHRLPPTEAHHRGDHRRGLQEGLPHRTALHRQALPQGQRTPHHRRPPKLARRHRRPHRHAPASDRDDLLFPTQVGTPISRNTFRTRIWKPAVAASGVGFNVRVHDLRHAHASWLLAGGADLKSVMDRMGHTQIQTTQKYLHTLPDTDQRNLDALSRIQGQT